MNETATQLLDHAQQLVQRRGFNAFSYKDLAAAVGIRTASIHYHFPSKADLGQALMARYRSRLDGALDELDRKHRTNRARLRGFIGLYRQTLQAGALCVCGSLAADLTTLPDAIQTEVAAYLDSSRAWLRRTLDAGQDAGEFVLANGSGAAASALLAALQGALLVARAHDHEPAVLQDVEQTFLASLARA